MTEVAAPASTVLVHTPDPGRWDNAVQGVRLLPHTASAPAMAQHLDAATLLVVDDALVFPFEALRDVDLDVPLAVRVPWPLDAAGLESVLGGDLLDHLTPVDVVAGPADAWGRVLARRRLPRSRLLGDGNLTLHQLVNRTRESRRGIDEAMRPHPLPAGAPFDPVNFTATARGGEHRLRDVKSRLRVERDLLRRELATVARQQPRTRVLEAIVAARWPEAWASALPPAVGTWAAVPIVNEPPSADLRDADVPIVAVPDHLRLPRPAGVADIAVVVADILHGPRHTVERLIAEIVRLLRPGGSLLLMAEVVPNPRREPGSRPEPLSAMGTLDLVARASGRQVILEDVRSYRRPGEDHHRAGLFRWRFLGTGRGVSSWT